MGVGCVVVVVQYASFSWTCSVDLRARRKAGPSRIGDHDMNLLPSSATTSLASHRHATLRTSGPHAFGGHALLRRNFHRARTDSDISARPMARRHGRRDLAEKRPGAHDARRCAGARARCNLSAALLPAVEFAEPVAAAALRRSRLAALALRSSLHHLP